MTAVKTTKLDALVPLLQAQVLTDNGSADIAGCYISDLLSDVLANAEPGMLWATVQVHRNVVSVAATKDVVAVLFTCGRKPAPAVVAEADENGLVLLATPLSTYEVAGKLWETGIR